MASTIRNQPQPSRLALTYLLEIRLCHDQLIHHRLHVFDFFFLKKKGQYPKIIYLLPVVTLWVSDLFLGMRASGLWTVRWGSLYT